MTGRLLLIATPIGHLGDISVRLRETLAGCDALACEDTRVTGKLLQHLSLRVPLLLLNEHTEATVSDDIVSRITQGQTIGIVSDAGTPAVSDPGARLVDRAHNAGIIITVIPGPSAVTAAISACGFAKTQWLFAGFLPKRQGERQQTLARLQATQLVCVCFESGRRVVAAINDIIAVYGAEAHVCLAKELTKLHETIYRGSATAVADWLAADAARQRGEFVLVLDAADAPSNNDAVDTTLKILLTAVPPSTAARLCAQLTGAPKNQCYTAALQIQRTPAD